MNTNKISADEGKHMERDQETRRRILTVAERLFLAKGFKGVSKKDIADDSCLHVVYFALIVLAVHRCTAGNWAKSYAESWEIRQTTD